MIASFVVLLLFAALAGWLRRRRLAATLAAVAMLAFLASACGAIPAWLLEQLQAPYVQRPALAWSPRNAIVLLTGDAVRVPQAVPEPGLDAYGRITQAAVLYHACRRSGALCRVLVTGGDPSHDGLPLAANYGRVLRALGVEDADLILESRSRTTWDNARFIRPLLARMDGAHVWLVSSAMHLRRSELYLAHFGIHPTPVRADYLRTRFTWLPDSANLLFTDLAVHEYLGIARFHLYNAMGWNAPASPPLNAPSR